MKKKVIPGMLVGFLIVAFLSGKIIPIPHGTREGGIISAIGVFLILILAVVTNYILVRLKHKKEG